MQVNLKEIEIGQRQPHSLIGIGSRIKINFNDNKNKKVEIEAQKQILPWDQLSCFQSTAWLTLPKVTHFYH